MADPSSAHTASRRTHPFGIAGLQLAYAPGDNIDQMIAEIAAVAKRFPWVSMVVAGELCGYGANTEFAKCMPDAEARLCRAAVEHSLWIIPGSLYENRDGAIFNTTPVINPQGEVIARYRKIFPFLPYEASIAPGNEFVVFDVPDVGRFGISICYDMWFPETTRSLISLGAEVILHPTMTNTIDREPEISIARASALINQCYFVDINVAGNLGVGQSVICGPGGEIIYQAGIGREIMPFEVDLDYLRRCRERGWQGLGQPLKSFRDNPVVYPAYAAARAPSVALESLGKLELPGRL
ncbi:MAG TPA: carbon-nitrogen hydrolase family protein [Dokdonella sp.]|uniref:carbon-nitrogen hydrolase family protein n=1 Tax=Dokdonella sp. TaxID=2291710 RepID=UPI002D7F5A63|nr:carbon-nitrogen hydrolase family protein [Dokdonella sp.]HET9032870.1 carbon-nitrogen hydrolase family protein [Dokdonella sp.]